MQTVSNMADYDIGKAFSRIEDELISSMIRNLEHHKAQELEEGYEWAQWQVEQLRALEEYRKRNRKKFPKKFSEINSKIPHLINEARADGQMEQEAEILEALSKGFKANKGSGDIVGAFFEVNDRKLNALIEATTNDFERAEVAILRRAEDQYRKVIFDAQVYANAGGTTYEKAVDMATKDFVSKGIDCIEYKNGARHTLSDYADMAIKTAVKRAYLTGEGEKRKEWGIATVIVNKRGNPCPKCAPFCGKVLIDDVWSGGSRKDGSYPLMSTAIEHGLYHPRCKDSHTTYFPGISTADDKWSKEELEEIGANYEADQKQQYAERQAEKYDRLAKTRLDSGNKRQYEARTEEWSISYRYPDNEGVFSSIVNTKTKEIDGNMVIVPTDIIKPHNIIKEMNKSEIGKELLSFIQENDIPVKIWYNIDVEKDLMGMFEEGEIHIYADHTKTIKETTLTVIHEATHAKYNRPNTKNQELECFKNEYRHLGIKLTDSVIKSIIRHIDRKYKHLEWE